eukprot:2683815-Rhodomonas_salina.4
MGASSLAKWGSSNEAFRPELGMGVPVFGKWGLQIGFSNGALELYRVGKEEKSEPLDRLGPPYAWSVPGCA